MNLSKMRNRINIQQEGQVQNDEGYWVTDWVDFMTIWAHIEPLRGRELIMAGASTTKVDTRIKTRYHKKLEDLDIDTESKFRIKYKKRTYEIEDIINVEELNREFEIMCNEVRT